MKILKIYALLILSASLLTTTPGFSSPDKNEKKKDKDKKEEKKEEPTDKKPDSKASYTKFIGKSVKQKGLVTIHKADNKYYLEIPSTLLGKDLMLSSKISQTSDIKIAMAGTMMGSPTMIAFTKSNESILLRNTNQKVDIIEGQDDIAKSIRRNNLYPSIEIFKIAEKSPNDSSYVIDVTNFLISTTGIMGVQTPMFSGPSGPPKLTPVANMNEVIDAKAFEKNLNFRCRLVYKVSEAPYEAEVTRSIILLPEKPIKGRKYDPKMGYFTTSRLSFDVNKGKSESYKYINRWNIQPKAEDLEAYKSGKLVEPEKPIIYYVDDAIPEKYRKYVKQGIEDWNIAFEKIGFKNAVIAKDYPKADSTFDPDDIRYSCVRYITTPIANAVGPSWTDPRSGEIIQGSVYFFHDLTKINYDWLFSQTAAINPEARKLIISDEQIGRALRYVMAHEVGHTIGLQHNMKASSNYPVDSLRSATFTQKYGTTPSIMDYARFNYIAQPEDKGVSLMPPLVGEYDIFAVKIGYKPIFEKDEKTTIKRWFDEVKGNNLYTFGPMSMLPPLDPSSQTEDLGNDPMKASSYGIKNAKYIMSNLKKWALEYGYEPKDLSDRYMAVIDQYNRYLGHVRTTLVGAYRFIPDLDDNQKSLIPVEREKRKAALQFLLKEIKDLPTWIKRDEIAEKIPNLQYEIDLNDLQTMMFSKVMSSIPASMEVNRLNNSYSGTEILNDIHSFVWKETLTGQNLDLSSRTIQYTYVKELMKSLELIKKSQAGNAIPTRRANNNFLTFGNEDANTATNIPYDSEKSTSVEFKNLCFAQLLKIKDLLAAKQAIGNKETKDHYRYLLFEIKKALE